MEMFRRYRVRKGGDGMEDSVAVEEPLALFVQYRVKDASFTQSLAVTMRTPGHDRELAAGLLLSEGIVQTHDDVIDIRPLGPADGNEWLVELAPHCDFEAWRATRHGFVSSSCGVCGKQSLDAVLRRIPSVPAGLRLTAETIIELPEQLRRQQKGFAETGGLHAAGLAGAGGTMDAVFEDIGRHNAMDKVCGWALLAGRLPLHDSCVVLSSRASFELVQKAAMAGIPALIAVGGASSLAIDTARAAGMTLIGFVRDGRYTVYAGDGRIDS